MGRKLVRDFVPGMRLAGEGPINGNIRIADDERERLLLGAEKVVEEANELLAAVKAELEANRDMSRRIGNDVRCEVGDVLAALRYTASICGVSIADVVRAKAVSHGEFTKHFVWEWPGDEQPRTMGGAVRKHDLQNADCPLNQTDILDSRGECTCPKEGT